MSSEWAAHWARHLSRDRRPYRCALCEKSFRDPHQILKHGETCRYMLYSSLRYKITRRIAAIWPYFYINTCWTEPKGMPLITCMFCKRRVLKQAVRESTCVSGQTHKYGSGEEDTEPLKKRFVCDLCPEGFVYMRWDSKFHPNWSCDICCCNVIN